MKLVSSIALGLALVAAPGLAQAPTAVQAPAEALATPPAGAQRYTILSTGGRHGTIENWTGPDGTLLSRLHLVLRGQVWDEEEAIRLGDDKRIAAYRLRGTSPNGDVGETFAVANGTATWKSPFDGGSKPYGAPAFYFPAGQSPRAIEPLLDLLLARPGEPVALLPGGQARAEKLGSTIVGKAEGTAEVMLWSITGLSGTPFTIWTDANGKYFAQTGGLDVIRAGFEDDAKTLEAFQDEAVAKQSPKLAQALATTPTGAVAFTDVRAFLDGKRYAEHQTVVVEKGRITAVGPAASVKVPAGAQLFPGAGRTLVPGLWDSHMHVGDDYTGPSELALGVTSVRDPGNNDALTVARAKRRAAGEWLAPHVYASSLIDGKGPNSAQVANIVTSEAEAVQAVRDAKAKGMVGVKFYGTFNPAWVKPAAAEAHRLGLHVHGHLPAGMRPTDALAAGYDELTHIYFVSMQAMPDAVVAQSNGMGRFTGTGTYMKDVKVDAEPLKSLIAQMAAKHIYSDPTLVVVEGLFVPENGDLAPEYAPFVGLLPPASERGFRSGGFAPPAGVTRADYRASFAKLVALVGAMHKAGVPIVAGTDGSGLELVRELELYVQAGFTPEEALAAATIETARLVGQEKETGSIAIGKAADLVLVKGDPSKRIGDLRHTETVMMDGKLMDAAKLRSAVGISGMPAFLLRERE